MLKYVICLFLIGVFLSWCSNNISKENNNKNIKSYEVEIQENPEVPSW